MIKTGPLACSVLAAAFLLSGSPLSSSLAEPPDLEYARTHQVLPDGTRYERVETTRYISDDRVSYRRTYSNDDTVTEYYDATTNVPGTVERIETVYYTAPTTVRVYRPAYPVPVRRFAVGFGYGYHPAPIIRPYYWPRHRVIARPYYPPYRPYPVPRIGRYHGHHRPYVAPYRYGYHRPRSHWGFGISGGRGPYGHGYGGFNFHYGRH